MFDLLIVDDEKIIREGLIKSTDWGKLGFNVIGTAKDGEEALKIYGEKHPDVLLLDIKMPGKNGIEVLKEIKAEQPLVEVVLLSGYDDFKYAKAGMEAGAYNYILKIDLVDELEKIFKKLNHQLLKRNQKRQEYSRLMNMEANYLLKELLRGRKVKWNNIDWENRVFCVVVEWSEKENIKIIEELFDAHKIPAPFIKGEREYYNIYIYMDDKCSILNACSFPKLLEDLSIREIKNISKWIIGVGGIKKGVSNIPSSYSEAMKTIDSMRKLKKHGIEFYEKLKAYNEMEGGEFEFRFMGHELLIGNNDNLIKNLKELFNKSYYKKGILVTDIKVQCIEILLSIKNIIKQNDLKGNVLITECLNSIEKYESIIDLEKYYMDMIFKLCNHINSSDKQYQLDRMLKVKKYVDENFYKNIKMLDAANLFYLSPSYFSIKFKELVGCNFSKYIIRKRIDAAKHLLVNSDFKIYEIADRVGYKDEKHFSKIFLAYENITPKEYRKQNKK